MINCACHDWRFSISDGSLVEPSGKGGQFSLPEAEIAVEGDAIEFA